MRILYGGKVGGVQRFESEKVVGMLDISKLKMMFGFFTNIIHTWNERFTIKRITMETLKIKGIIN